MKKILKIFVILLNLIILTQSSGAAMENKIKFDKETYYLSNPDSKTKNFTYLKKDENIGNWHTKLLLENLPDLTNETEAAAEFAHRIQEENRGASVLLYPDAAMVGYLSFPTGKEYYEYNAVVFQKTVKGLDKFGFAKRFYASELGGSANARTAAIDFAEKNNKKYMEMVNKEAPKYNAE